MIHIISLRHNTFYKPTATNDLTAEPQERDLDMMAQDRTEPRTNIVEW